MLLPHIQALCKFCQLSQCLLQDKHTERSFFFFFSGPGSNPESCTIFSINILKELKEKHCFGVPMMAQQLKNPTSIREDLGSIPGFAQWVEDLALHELWGRPQTRLWSCVAVALAQAGSFSSHSTPRLGTSMCRGVGTPPPLKKSCLNTYLHRVPPPFKQSLAIK